MMCAAEQLFLNVAAFVLSGMFFFFSFAKTFTHTSGARA